MILVTGADGLIGRHICALLRSARIAYRPFDVKLSPTDDIRNRPAIAEALKGVRGVVHLAAVSRVVWGERNPMLCAATNVDALADLLRLCVEGSRPWFIFASSREVYGEPSAKCRWRPKRGSTWKRVPIFWRLRPDRTKAS